MKNINKFIPLINEMPLMEQAFTSNKSSWQKYMDTNNSIGKIFDKNISIQISREDLFNWAKSDLDRYIVSTIVWGYPRGMRGNNFSKLVKHIQELENILMTAKRENILNWEEHYNKIKDIPGLGLSTYSKLLYFLNIEVEGHKSLILDQRIIDTINNAIFIEFTDLESINYANASNKYPAYLHTMNTLAQKLEIDSGKLEMFLFVFGLNLKISSTKTS